MIEEDGPERKEINMERRLSLRKVSKNDVLDVKNSKKSDAFDPKITISRTSLISRNCKVYKRRWLMLALFVLYSTSNAMQWIQYSIIENVIVRFYGISSSYVEWTSMVYMVSYIILVVPGSWALDKFGLRKCVLAGALGTCLGSWLKVFSTSPESFPIGFFGHSIVAVSQVFVLSVPARLAAVWFGQDQVSSACSIGVFGNQLGVALGFLIPPSVVPDVEDTNVIEGRLGLLFKSVAGFTSILLVLIIFLYEEQPPLPPSQAALKQKEETPDFVGSIKRLLSNFGYILLLVSYGINVGVFYALSTLLNKVITTHFENASADAGRIGLTIVLLGTLGSCLSGFVLDKTHKFKEVTLVVYLFSLIGLIVYNSTLDAGYISIVYVTAGFLGFFMTGYLPVGFELAAELTYPEPEGTSVGILNGFCQIFGILFTLGYSAAIESFGTRNAGWGLAATLALGTLMTYFIPKNYRRQESGKDEKEGA